MFTGARAFEVGKTSHRMFVSWPKFMAGGPKRGGKNMKEFTRTEVVGSIKAVSQEAKQQARKKKRYYERGEHRDCADARNLSTFLYLLKAAAIRQAEKDGYVRFVGLTLQTFREFEEKTFYNHTREEYDVDYELVYEETISLLTFETAGGNIFHLPNPGGARKGDVVAEVDDELPPSRNETENSDLEKSVRILGSYIGQKRLMKILRRTVASSRDRRNAFYLVVVRFFPEFEEKYQTTKDIYAYYYPGKNQTIQVVREDLFFGIGSCWQFSLRNYRRTHALPCDYSKEIVSQPDWQVRFSKEEIVTALLNWRSDPLNIGDEFRYRRGSGYGPATDGIFRENSIKRTRVENLNLRVGEEKVRLFSQETEEDYFREKFMEILESGESIRLQDFALPEIDQRDERAKTVLYPDIAEVCGKFFPLKYSRSGDGGLIAHIDPVDALKWSRYGGRYEDSAKREVVRLLGGSTPAVLDEITIPSGLRIYGSEDGRTISEVVREIERKIYEGIQYSFIWRYDRNRLSLSSAFLPDEMIWASEEAARKKGGDYSVDRVVVCNDDVVGEVCIYGSLKFEWEPKRHKSPSKLYDWTMNKGEAEEICRKSNNKYFWYQKWCREHGVLNKDEDN